MPALCFTAAVSMAAIAPSRAQSDAPGPQQSCGELVTIATHGSTAMRYALAHPGGASNPTAPTALLLLVGGGGFLNLDDQGCPRALRGNFLVRSLAHFHAEGFITALIDSPSDHSGDEGLAGFRATTQHAEDLGKVIADLRARTRASVWVVGTSRGTISAANAAVRLSGAGAADGTVLSSAVTSGGTSRQRPWVSQTVFDFSLEKIRMPVLIVGHEADACIRTPPAEMAAIAARIGAVRKQVVSVSAGPNRVAHSGTGLEACEGRTAHGFLDHEAEVAAGIARFIRGEAY